MTDNKKKLNNINLNDDTGDFLEFDLKSCLEKAYDAFEAGKYEEAAGLYLDALRYNITDYNAIYLLACCYAEMNKPELAAKYLYRSVSAGFDNVPHLDTNRAFDKIKNHKVFAETLDDQKTRIKSKVQKLGELLYLDSSSLFECLVKLPENYDPKKKYKLVIGLHGRGNSHEEFITIWENAGLKPDFIFATPRAHYPFLFNNDVGYSWNLRIPEDDQTSDSTARMSEIYITEIAMELSSRCQADAIYLAGFSQGAHIALQTGIKYHELFTGIISFSGWLPGDWMDNVSNVDIGAAEDLRVFLSHGTRDMSIPYEYGTNARDLLTGYGFDVTFESFEDMHTLPEEIVHKAFDWLKKG